MHIYRVKLFTRKIKQYGLNNPNISIKDLLLNKINNIKIVKALFFENPGMIRYNGPLRVPNLYIVIYCSN